MPTTNLAAVDIGAGITDAWRSVMNFAPKLLAFLVILVIGVIIAKILQKAVAAILAKVGFDRIAERGSLKQAMVRSNTTASGIVAKIVYYTIVLLTLQYAFNAWGPNPVSDLLTDVVLWLPRALVAVVIVVVAAAIASAVKDLINSTMGALSYGRVLANIASIFILALGIIAALNQIGVATTVTTPVLIAVLAAIAGIAIVGVGGGLIRPMQQRWENWLDKAEHEIPRMRETVESTSDRTMAHATTARATEPAMNTDQIPAVNQAPNDQH
jgi:hypothetical protein